jgi:hypothetical protein
MSLRFIGWEDWEGDNGNSITTEDDDNANTCDFLEVTLRRL